MATALSRPRKHHRWGTPSPAQRLQACTLDELDALASAWSALDRTARLPSSQFSWTRACLAAFADEAPHVVGLARDGHLVAVAPLVRERRGGVHRLHFAGACQLGAPMELVGDDAALAGLARVLVQSGLPLELARLPSDSPALAALLLAARGRARASVRPAAPVLSLRLDDRHLEPERLLSVTSRGKLRRARRGAEQRGAVTTEIHAPSLDDLPRLLDTAFAVDPAEPRDEGGPAASELQRAVFYRHYLQAACADETLRISLLRIGDRVAAVQLAIETAGGYWLLKSAEAARFADCAPGSLLMRETIRYAAEAALDRFEFWGSDHGAVPWKARSRACVSLVFYPFGLRGAAAWTFDAAAAVARRLVRV